MVAVPPLFSPSIDPHENRHPRQWQRGWHVGQGLGPARQLATELGFDAIDVGGLTQDRLLEPCAMLWIHLAYRGDRGRDYGFALVKR